MSKDKKENTKPEVTLEKVEKPKLEQPPKKVEKTRVRMGRPPKVKPKQADPEKIKATETGMLQNKTLKTRFFMYKGERLPVPQRGKTKRLAKRYIGEYNPRHLMYIKISD